MTSTTPDAQAVAAFEAVWSKGHPLPVFKEMCLAIWLAAFAQGQAVGRAEKRKPLWEIPCSDGAHESFWQTVVMSLQWRAWEKEVSRRSHEHLKQNDKVFTGCWDVDECRECGWISPAHFQEFLTFLRTTPLTEGEG